MTRSTIHGSDGQGIGKTPATVSEKPYSDGVQALVADIVRLAGPGAVPVDDRERRLQELARMLQRRTAELDELEKAKRARDTSSKVIPFSRRAPK
ncbi:hypothetical protein ABIE09_001741 [Lysobacter enzymogenes]|uniref:hypothetical protein n=1 Tax=Lysobacter enzymogenes TaxID=69 RepID=UPI00339B0C16